MSAKASQTDGESLKDRLDVTGVLSNEEEREVVWRRVFISQGQRDVAEVFDVSKGTISRIMAEYRRISGPEMERELIDEFDGVVEPYREEE